MPWLSYGTDIANVALTYISAPFAPSQRPESAWWLTSLPRWLAAVDINLRLVRLAVRPFGRTKLFACASSGFNYRVLLLALCRRNIEQIAAFAFPPEQAQ